MILPDRILLGTRWENLAVPFVFYMTMGGSSLNELDGKRLLDMQEARDCFVHFISERVRINRELGIKQTFAIESHTLQKYGMEAGLDLCCCELLLGNPDHILAFTRGAARG